MNDPLLLNKHALIQQLQLQPHVEGGYFRRTFQADHRQKINILGEPRYTLTSIYYMLTDDSPIGRWHQNSSDIIHYFHSGHPITYYLIYPNGKLEQHTMGAELNLGQQLQLCVRGGVWKASKLCSGEYGLISEAVAPGFDYDDHVLGDQDSLLKHFPQYGTVIKDLF